MINSGEKMKLDNERIIIVGMICLTAIFIIGIIFG